MEAARHARGAPMTQPAPNPVPALLTVPEAASVLGIGRTLAYPPHSRRHLAHADHPSREANQDPIRSAGRLHRNRRLAAQLNDVIGPCLKTPHAPRSGLHLPELRSCPIGGYHPATRRHRPDTFHDGEDYNRDLMTSTTPRLAEMVTFVIYGVSDSIDLSKNSRMALLKAPGGHVSAANGWSAWQSTLGQHWPAVRAPLLRPSAERRPCVGHRAGNDGLRARSHRQTC